MHQNSSLQYYFRNIKLKTLYTDPDMVAVVKNWRLPSLTKRSYEKFWRTIQHVEGPCLFEFPMDGSSGKRPPNSKKTYIDNPRQTSKENVRK